MKRLLLLLVVSLSAAKTSAAPTSDQCNRYATWVAAFALGRDNGKSLGEMVGIVRDMDLVKLDVVKPGADQDAIKRQFVKDVLSLYNQDRYLSPDDIMTNRYIACMNPRG